MVHRGCEQPSPKPVTAPVGDDVELLEVRVGRACIDRGTEAELREPVGPGACEEHGDLTALDKGRRPLRDHLGRRRRFAEPRVERVEEPAESGRVGGGR
jgi:hypothetical protein